MYIYIYSSGTQVSGIQSFAAAGFSFNEQERSIIYIYIYILCVSVSMYVCVYELVNTYPLVMTNIAMENLWPIETDALPN